MSEPSGSRQNYDLEPTHGTTRRGVYGVLFCVALVARLSVLTVNMLRDEPRFLQPDSQSYIETARSLLEHRAVRDDAGKPAEGRVPVYPLLLACLFATGIASPVRLTGAILVQCLLGACVVVLAARASRSLPGYLGVLPVGLLLAVEPSTVAYSNLILSEMLYSLVLILALVAWERLLRLQDTGSLLWLGATLGVLSLVRPIGQFFPLAVLPILVWARWGRPGMLRGIGIFVLVAVSPTVAWSLRNYVELGSFGLQSTGAWGQAIFAQHVEGRIGRNDPSSTDGFIKPWEPGFGTDQGLTLPEASARRSAYFRKTVAAHPAAAARQWLTDGIILMGVPDAQLDAILLKDPPNPPENSVRGRIEWLGELGLLAVPVTLGMMISLGGVAAIPWLLAHWSRWTPHRQRIMGFVVIAVLYHWAISSFVGHQGERLRVPIIPLLALLLASGLGHLIRGTERLPLDPAAAFRLE